MKYQKKINKTFQILLNPPPLLFYVFEFFFKIRFGSTLTCVFIQRCPGDLHLGEIRESQMVVGDGAGPVPIFLVCAPGASGVRERLFQVTYFSINFVLPRVNLMMML